MKYLLICLLLLSILIPVSYGADEKPGPRMLIVEPVFDAGKVNQGNIIKHDFIVKNMGNKELNITRVDPGWGCALADYDKAIPPAGSGKISISVKTDAYSSPIVKSAKIVSNDPENSETRVQIKAYVVNYVKVAPPNVYMKKSGGTIPDASATISTDRKTPLVLEVVSFTIHEKVTYTIEETKKGREFKVIFSHIQESEEAYFGILSLKTNYEDKPTLKIIVRSKFE